MRMRGGTGNWREQKKILKLSKARIQGQHFPRKSDWFIGETCLSSSFLISSIFSTLLIIASPSQFVKFHSPYYQVTDSQRPELNLNLIHELSQVSIAGIKSSVGWEPTLPLGGHVQIILWEGQKSRHVSLRRRRLMRLSALAECPRYGASIGHVSEARNVSEARTCFYYSWSIPRYSGSSMWC